LRFWKALENRRSKKRKKNVADIENFPRYAIEFEIAKLEITVVSSIPKC